MKRVIHAVFWDLDGTLIDSEPSHAAGGAYATEIICLQFQLAARPLPQETRGMENRAIFDLLFGHEVAAERPAIFNQWQHLAINYTMDKIHHSQQVSQAVTLFKHFAASGVVQSIVSNSETRLVRHSLATLGILEQCQQIFARDNSIAYGKPNPELYLKALAYHQQSGGDCLAFEDSGTGIAAAKSAGLNVVGIGEQNSIYQPILTLSLSQADWTKEIDQHFKMK